MKNKIILNRKELKIHVKNKYSKVFDLFSDKVGIVNAIMERHELDKYGIYMYQCLSASSVQLFGCSREVTSGGLGVSFCREDAIIGCIAEAIERYCMTYIPVNELKYCELNELPNENKFDQFYLYSDNQYKENSCFANPKVDKIYWTKIYSLSNKDKHKYWPASLIYLPFDISNPVAETSSTGLAAGFTIDDCILSGLLELIERDALMINFMQKLPANEIDLTTLSENNSDFVNVVKQDYNIKIYKLISDIKVPIFLTYIWTKKHGKIHYGIGASANIDSELAISKSVRESLFTYFYSLNIMDLKQDNPLKIKTLYEHFLYYQDEKFEKLLFHGEKIKYVREKYDFDYLINELEKLNLEIYFKELTTDDVKNSGLKVVKTIVPQLIDLNKTHSMQRLGAERFFSVPRKLNLQFSTELSTDPHPFP